MVEIMYIFYIRDSPGFLPCVPDFLVFRKVTDILTNFENKQELFFHINYEEDRIEFYTRLKTNKHTYIKNIVYNIISKIKKLFLLYP